ncbi:BREX-1 system adenine-specific DNA-methyltransferase PglX [Liquorilactobacillus hordei DSM 19519]|uniref:site-specific DNA-methyltransferase (adenine-specific) n=2 Tax=Liquorilactobacillus hordei TaxID=468911 RepID=A0A0R1MED1_9LACO|nr:hypothetical protein FC92_GL001169 [Liquorilactobacillus hordei DSM 19519]QYH53149.1 BREX-1 system adenine-specific DNA-methyltransferase PglX [Liquorilactobacillus hordei DSM 19519]
MGSGHILVYAFDVFMQLYVAEGYRERDAAEFIMTNNLYGLEIDKRAYQLAYFAIMMKGREYNRKILNKNVKLNLYQFIDSEDIPTEYFERLDELSTLPRTEFTKKLNQLKSILEQFAHATEIGSVLHFNSVKKKKIAELREFVNVFDNFSDMDILYQLPEAHEKIAKLLDIVEVIVSKYTTVVTNPPYLNKMSNILDKYVKNNYPEVKTDLFSVFIKMNSQMLVKDGYAGFMTPFVWMFIKSYEELRTFLITDKSLSNLVQMEYSAFEEATVPVCCFTIKNTKNEPVGNYFKLSDFRGGMEVQKAKVLEGVKNPTVSYVYQTNQESFTKIPGSPISFWVSENTFNIFASNASFEDIYHTRAGMITGNNKHFIRMWHEIGRDKIGLLVPNRQTASASEKKWFPYSKGGEFKRWYGNNEFVINWENDGSCIRNLKNKNGKIPAHAFNLDYIFHSQITWSSLSSRNFAARYCVEGFLFDASGSFAIVPECKKKYVLSYLNSKVVKYYLNLLNPTLNFQKGNINALPLVKTTNCIIEEFAKTNINISKAEWDSFEQSWDFSRHPLI